MEFAIYKLIFHNSQLPRENPSCFASFDYSPSLSSEALQKSLAKMQNEEGVITELYIPRKWYPISFHWFTIRTTFSFPPFFFFWNFWIPYSWLIRDFFGSVPRRTGSSLQRTTPRSRSTSAISMRTASTPASSPPSLSAVSSVLRSLFFLHAFFFPSWFSFLFIV